MANISFKEFMDSLSDLGSVSREDPAVQKRAREVVHALRALNELDRNSLARFVEDNPDAVPFLASCGGLGQEQLKNQLRFRLGSAGWTTLARTRPDELIAVLDDAYGIVIRLQKQLPKKWTFSDVLAERQLWSRRTGAKAVGQGRSVEDEVEGVVQTLGIPYEMRTRFEGRNHQTAPCDLAIPGSGANAMIAVALKSNNSTGSKQTDAVREIEEMANVRLPRQYIFAVFDGIGWLSRQADLHRIYDLWARNEINGLYSLAHLDRFEADLLDAATLLRISRNP